MFKYIIPGILFLVLYAGSLFLKNAQVEKKNSRYVPTVFNLHKKSGTPVYTEKVKRGAFNNYVTITGEVINSHVVCYITPFVRKSIKSNANVTYETETGKSIDGKIQSISGAVSNLTGLFEVTVALPMKNIPKDKKIISLRVPTREINNVIVVSREAVNTRGESPVVFVVNDKKVEKKKIELAGSNPFFYWIKSGVQEGEEIIVSDTRYFKGGEFVDVISSGVEL